jgi:hypothetical protein
MSTKEMRQFAKYTHIKNKIENIAHFLRLTGTATLWNRTETGK